VSGGDVSLTPNRITHHNLHSINMDLFQSDSFQDKLDKIRVYRDCIDQAEEFIWNEKEARG